MSRRGALIVFEGLDRTGKSSQAIKLVEKFISKGLPAELQTFPDRTTALGQIINDYLSNTKNLDDRTIHLLFAANRWEKRAAMLEKIQQGVTLVVDRYAFSGVAFSSAKPGLSVEWCRNPDVGLPKPDLVMFLTADPKELRLRGGYGEERYEKEEFQRIVAERYSELEDSSWVKIDASGSFEEIAERISSVVDTRLKDIPEEIGGLWETV